MSNLSDLPSAAVICEKILDQQPGRLVGPGETAAVAPGLSKTCALFFDRVWGGPRIPGSIRFNTNTDYEFLSIILLALLTDRQIQLAATGNLEPIVEGGHDRLVEDCGQLSDQQQLLIHKAMMEAYNRALEDADISQFNPVEDSADKMPLESSVGRLARGICESLEQSQGVIATPFYPRLSDYRREYKPGQFQTILVTFQELDIVAEKDLNWEQVEEFRRDDEARIKLRRLLRWLDSELVYASSRQIADTIAVRLDDYRWALRKHGIKTVTGVLTSALDGKALAAIGIAVGGLAAATEGVAALMAGGDLAFGRVLIKAAEALVDIKDYRRSIYPEIAYVAEISKKLGVKGDGSTR